MADNRPLISVDKLFQAINSGRIRVTVARINPNDMSRVDLEWLHMMIRCPVIPAMDVERGMLYVDSVPR